MSTENPKPPMLEEYEAPMRSSETVPIVELPNFLDEKLRGLERDFDAQVDQLVKSISNPELVAKLKREADSLKKHLAENKKTTLINLSSSMNQQHTIMSGDSKNDNENKIRKTAQQCIVFHGQYNLFIAKWRGKISRDK